MRPTIDCPGVCSSFDFTNSLSQSLLAGALDVEHGGLHYQLSPVAGMGIR